MVGTHRRLLARDVLAYQAKIYRVQDEALNAMGTLDQEMDPYEHLAETQARERA